jgi:hypothetical protein
MRSRAPTRCVAKKTCIRWPHPWAKLAPQWAACIPVAPPDRNARTARRNASPERTCRTCSARRSARRPTHRSASSEPPRESLACWGSWPLRTKSAARQRVHQADARGEPASVHPLDRLAAVADDRGHRPDNRAACTCDRSCGRPSLWSQVTAGSGTSLGWTLRKNKDQSSRVPGFQSSKVQSTSSNLRTLEPWNPGTLFRTHSWGKPSGLPPLFGRL